MKLHKSGKQIIKGTIKKQTGMWEVTLETQQSEVVANNILSQTSKSELAHDLHAELLIPTTARRPRSKTRTRLFIH